jgi:outer membrane receptor protein involved in Fe transport
MRRRSAISLLVPALALAVPLAAGARQSGADPPAEDETPQPPPAAGGEETGCGRVRLLIFDAESSEALAGIRVEFDGRRLGVTDADGAVVIGIAPGSYVFELSGEGYAANNTSAIPVVSGKLSEAFVDIAPAGGRAETDVEAATAPRPEVEVDESLPRSRIVGTVVHSDTGEPVPDVRIFLRGVGCDVTSDESGRFSVEVPVGAHDLSAVHPRFSTINRSEIEVVEGEPTELRIEAVPVGAMLEDLVITAPRIEGGSAALLQERRESGSVSDVIGAEQMSKSGDSDAAGALKRVTGVTIIGGKYVYVRGLGERYSSSLLNGAMLPSPEPERRVVPLDLFPTGVLDSIVVQKTFSPDMPGEFGGGVVMLRTRDYPDELALDLEAGGGWTVGTTMSDGLMAVGGPTDWLGWDNGWRDLPPSVRRASKDQKLLEGNMFTDGYTADELEKFGEALRNNWRTYRDEIPPDAGGKLTVGHKLDLPGAKLGFLAGAIYDNGWEREQKKLDILASGANDEPEVFHSYQWDETTNVIKVSGILTLGLELGEDHLIRSTTLLNRIAEDAARFYWGYNRDVKSDIRVTRIRWVERQLLTQQLVGEHIIPPLMDLGVDWRYTYSRASRHEPDRKEVTYYREGDTDLWIASNRPDGNSRVFSDMLDEVHDLGLDLSLPFEQWSDEIAEVRLGGLLMFKDRGSDTRRFKYKDRPSPPALAGLPPEELFSNELIGHWSGTQVNNLFTEITRETDNYSAEQQIRAAYAMTDFPLGLGLRVLGGLRIEKSRQFTRTYELFNPDAEPLDSKIETTDYLPAATLSWEFSDDMLVRAGVSQTVSRPDFREMSPARFTNVIGGRDIVGNTDLKRTLITNVDLRWEWYPAPGESVSLGGFFKHFEDPIEMIIMPGAQFYETFANAEAARNFGLELDVFKSFGFIHESIEDLYFGGNATWVYSRIELGEDVEGTQTNEKRPLQGQSPYIFNAQLGYDNIEIGTKATILYNVFGERIRIVGAVGLPDIYEQPFHQLDLVASQELGAGFQLKLEAKNIVDLPARFKQAKMTTEKWRKGRSFSLSLKWSY